MEKDKIKSREISNQKEFTNLLDDISEYFKRQENMIDSKYRLTGDKRLSEDENSISLEMKMVTLDGNGRSAKQLHILIPKNFAEFKDKKAYLETKKKEIVEHIVSNEKNNTADDMTYLFNNVLEELINITRKSSEKFVLEKTREIATYVYYRFIEVGGDILPKVDEIANKIHSDLPKKIINEDNISREEKGLIVIKNVKKEIQENFPIVITEFLDELKISPFSVTAERKNTEAPWSSE